MAVFNERFFTGLAQGVDSALNRRQRQEVIDLQRQSLAFKREQQKQDALFSNEINQVFAGLFAEQEDEKTGEAGRELINQASELSPNLARAVLMPKLEELKSKGVEIPESTVKLITNSKPGSPESEVIKKLTELDIGGQELANVLSSESLTSDAILSASEQLKVRKSATLSSQRIEVLQKRIANVDRKLGKAQKILSGVSSALPRARSEKTADKLKGLIGAINQRIESLGDRRSGLLSNMAAIKATEQSQQFSGEQSTERQDRIDARQGQAQRFQSGESDRVANREVELLMDRGFSKEFAQDATKGRVKIETDQFGQLFQVNSLTGIKTPLNEPDAQKVRGLKDEREQINTPGGEPLSEAVLRGTGLFSNIQAAISNALGPFSSEEFFKQNTIDRQRVFEFRKIGIESIISNERYPVKEVEAATGLLPDPDIIFTDPKKVLTEFLTFQKFIVQRIKLKERALRGKITNTKRGELVDQISGFNEVLGNMEAEGFLPITTTSDELINLNLNLGERAMFNGREVIRNK